MTNESLAKNPRPRRVREDGSAMIIVVTILAALLAGGAVAIQVQVLSTRASGIVRANRSSLYCAEAGLAAARPLIGTNFSLWKNILDTNPNNDPIWYPIRGDIDEPPDGVMDFEVTVRDNLDEPLPHNPNEDTDQRVFIISRCTKYPNTPRAVLELVSFTGGGTVYRNQSGQGSGNTGNAN